MSTKKTHFTYFPWAEGVYIVERAECIPFRELMPGRHHSASKIALFHLFGPNVFSIFLPSSLDAHVWNSSQ